MEGARGELKHVVVVKFKEGIPPHEIEQHINDYANLVNLIPSMKSFHWGRDVGVCGMDEGYTHIFECTFETEQDVVEYMAHHSHREFADLFIPKLDKFLIIDYKPTLVHP
ncbi:unnamed protein product [Linum trigynum]|uniref:Stress-response A/B barrel domain-containing protein n=1 Tax=Linum trigynum TaxID=586398 RepID=A0AAV2F3Q6_9ROSI